MLNWLANAIAKIGLAIHVLSPYPVKPTSCSQYGDINYCYYEGSPGTKKVLYFMHGFSFSAETWSSDVITGDVELSWRNSGAERPHIVAISKGVWWYTEREQGEELNHFVTSVESLLFDFEPQERLLYGESMGAHNALRWSADFPEKFNRLALGCPALPRYWVENAAPSEGFPPWQVLAELLIDGNYQVSSQPKYNILQQAGTTKLPPLLYVVMASRDEFGFLAGDTSLVQNLEQNPHIRLQWEKQNVTHCRVRSEALAQFLAPP